MANGDEKIHAMFAIPDEVLRKNKRRFFSFNRSILARKIIVFNLIALAILVSGVLYLNQNDDSLLKQHRVILSQQAEILATAIVDNTRHGKMSPQYFSILTRSLDAVAQLYDANGELLSYHIPNGENAISTANNLPTSASALTILMQKVWDTVASAAGSEVSNEESQQTQFEQLVVNELSPNNNSTISTYMSNGEMFVAITEPILIGNDIHGVILLSTRSGEIDAVIRADREKILQIFILAILSSIVLSVVLANSIARPLRRLSRAAETTQDNAGGRLNPAQIQIPDLTARPDEIGDLSRAMRAMTEALFDRIDENKHFAADVAHEIKNPLTSLRSAVETLAYPLDEDERESLLSVIQNDVNRLDRLVTDISNASRLEGELVRDVWKPVDLHKMLKNLSEYHAAEQENLEISLVVGQGNMIVDGLEGRLAQVFGNVIRNAMGFVPEIGWIQVSVCEGEDGFIEVKISDNGPGIPKESVSNVFQRFYSERPANQFGDHSGLGLAISKQIVEAHKGTISASNASPRGGAEFTVRLPK